MGRCYYKLSTQFMCHALPGTTLHARGSVAFRKRKRERRTVTHADGMEVAVTALSNEYCQKRSERRRVELASRKACMDRADALAQHALHQRQSLKKLGSTWLGFPHTCPALTSVATAEAVVTASDDGLTSLSHLSECWISRHDGVPASLKEKKRLPSLTACYQQGTCTCGQRHKQIRLLMDATLKLFKSRWSNKKDGEALDQGRVIAAWFSPPEPRGADEVADPHCLLWTHIPLMYFKPFRPTMLTMVASLDEDFADIIEHFVAGKESFTPFVTLRAELQDTNGFTDLPAFSGFAQFMKSLDLSRSWYLRFWSLSSRNSLAAMPAGHVRATSSFAESAALLWQPHGGNELGAAWIEAAPSGEVEHAAEPVIQEDQDEHAASDGSSDVIVSVHELQGNEEAPAAPAPDTCAQESDSEPEDALAAEFLALMRAGDEESAASSDSSSSSSSSSSTSSSQSDSSNSSGSSTSGASGQSGAAVDQNADAEQGAAVAGRQRRAQSFAFGPFSFTYRPPVEGKAGYQALCRLHGREGSAACTKTASFPVDDEAVQADVVRRLKSWCLRGAQCETKQEHQGSRRLPPEDEEHALLSDEALEQRALEL